MPDRIVALGASNLTWGFHVVVSIARAAWGPDVDVFAALGYGRSYGARSMVLGRSLPGILESGLWRRIEELPPAVTRGLITDVGNDILYGFSASQTLTWVEETVDRLSRIATDIILTDLPIAGLRRLSGAKFLLLRSILFPRCRLSQSRIIHTAERVNDGLSAFAVARGLHLRHLKDQWYGIDPIHIRPSQRRPAWKEILSEGLEDTGCGAVTSWWEGLRLYFMPPERRWIFGIERITPQRGRTLPKGGRVWLF